MWAVTHHPPPLSPNLQQPFYLKRQEDMLGGNRKEKPPETLRMNKLTWKNFDVSMKLNSEQKHSRDADGGHAYTRFTAKLFSIASCI